MTLNRPPEQADQRFGLGVTIAFRLAIGIAGPPLNAVANLAFLELFHIPMLRGRALHSA